MRHVYRRPHDYVAKRRDLNVLHFVPYAVLTGTASDDLTEVEVVAGGETIIVTLTGDTWKAAGTGPIGTTANTQAIIDGISAATSPAAHWNAEWRDKEVTTAVVRTSATICTITMSSQAAISGSFDQTANETITATVPTQALTVGGAAIVATPTFDAIATVSGFQSAWAGGANVILGVGA